MSVARAKETTAKETSKTAPAVGSQKPKRTKTYKVVSINVQNGREIAANKLIISTDEASGEVTVHASSEEAIEKVASAIEAGAHNTLVQGDNPQYKTALDAQRAASAAVKDQTQAKIAQANKVSEQARATLAAKAAEAIKAAEVQQA